MKKKLAAIAVLSLCVGWYSAHFKTAIISMIENAYDRGWDDAFDKGWEAAKKDESDEIENTADKYRKQWKALELDDNE